MQKFIYVFILFLIMACKDFPNSVERDNPNDPRAQYNSQPPVVHFTVTPDSGQYRETLFTFDASQSVEPELPGTPLYFSWDFRGDGHWTPFTNKSKAIAQIRRSGHVKPRVRVRGGRGLIAEDSTNVYVYKVPYANFGWKKDQKGTIHLDAFLSHGYEPNFPLQYRWDFNSDDHWDWGWSDNSWAFFDAPEGPLEVKLEVKDHHGLTKSIRKELSFLPMDILLADFKFEGNSDDSGPFYIKNQLKGAQLTSGRTGARNTAYAFDGQDDEIVLYYQNFLKKNNNFAISFWIRINELGRQILKCDGLSSSGYTITSVEDGSINFATPKYTIRGYSNSISEHKWYHVYCSINSANRVSIYINGENKTATYDHKGPISYSGFDRFYIGRHFKGSIDNLMIFNRTLSSSEIKTLYYLLD